MESIDSTLDVRRVISEDGVDHEIRDEFQDEDHDEDQDGYELHKEGQVTASKAWSQGPKSEGFRAGRNPRPSDVFIAIMGVTGAGKSSFIKVASGSETIKIGHSLESCTSDVEVHAYDVSPNKTIFLIDTPGFDDTNRTDTEVLRDISTWLGSSYQNKVLLHGIIYLHRISNARMQGTAKKNLIMFKKLCGEDALKRVILVTTMWDKVSEEEGIAREQELLDTPEFWGFMMERGSVCRRHLNQAQTAHDIINSLAVEVSAVTTSLQKELVDEHRTLDNTSAGRELESELRKEREVWGKRLKETEEPWKEALDERDRDAQNAIADERTRYKEMIQAAERKTETLRETLESLRRQHDERRHDEIVARISPAGSQSTVAQASTTQPKVAVSMPLVALFISDAKHQPPRDPTPATDSAYEIGFPKYTCAVGNNSVSVVNQDNFATTFLVKETLGVLKNGVRWDFVAHGSGHSGKVRDTSKLLYRSSLAGSEPIEWHTSPGLSRIYPNLWKVLAQKGMAHLQYVALGTCQSYYILHSGQSLGAGPQNFLNAMRSVRAEPKHKIYAVAFGMGEAYFISYGENKLYLGYLMDLGNRYPALSTFLEEMSKE